MRKFVTHAIAFVLGAIGAAQAVLHALKVIGKALGLLH